MIWYFQVMKKNSVFYKSMVKFCYEFFFIHYSADLDGGPMGAGSSFSSSTVIMSNGLNGSPQVNKFTYIVYSLVYIHLNILHILKSYLCIQFFLS